MTLPVTERTTSYRSPISVTLSVWMALFLREALFRLSTGRAAWMWLLLEPIIHIAAMAIIFSTIRMKVMGGIDVKVWLTVGMLAFLMFKRTGLQAKKAISANRSLFVYRQVKPVDTVLVRAYLEAFLTIIVSIILCVGMSLFAVDMRPDDPLTVLLAVFGLWLIGIGFGLITSVLIELVAELDKILNIVMMPLYILSGVILPISSVPLPYRDWLLMNPLVHGIEGARLGMSNYYHAVSGLDLIYLYQCALVTVFFGLVLQQRFAKKMITL